MKYAIVIAVVVVAGIGAVLGGIVVGARTFEPTVVEKPYEQGLVHDETKAKRQTLGWHVQNLTPDVAAGDVILNFNLLGKEKYPLSNAECALRLVRSGNAKATQELAVSGSADGVCSFKTHLPEAGPWNGTLVVTHKKDTVWFDVAVNVR